MLSAQPATDYSTLVKLSRLSLRTGRIAEEADALHTEIGRLIDDLAPPMWADEDSDRFFDLLIEDAVAAEEADNA